MAVTLPRIDMSGLQWTPDVSIYRQQWRENTGACLQAPAGEGITMTINNRPRCPAGWAGRCPTCRSRQPSMHPAVSGGGEVTMICPDSWHDGDPVTEEARQRVADEMAETARKA
jgi:hypothetical protein